MNPLDMTGRTVLVSGASSGLGQATARTLSELGAKIVVHGRDQKRIDETLALLSGSGHIGAPFDLVNHDEIPGWFSGLIGQVGPLYGLVYSAGILTGVPLKALSTRALSSMTEVNVHAAIALAKAFRLPSNRVEGANIVFVSSIAGLVGSVGQVAYSATKGALIAMTRSMAVELARDGIRVNCIAPGHIRTQTADKFLRAVPEPLKALEAKHPLGFGEPSDVAYGVAYLMAGTGRWVTGSTLVVDGGYSAQ
jgi:NAD(P)-dependent dehydrogenase (short-subunit alcohol dehydrogenase family)